MAIRHAEPGEVVDVRPLGPALGQTTTRTLIKTEALEVIRIVMPAGKSLPPHAVPGEITVQCLEGRVDFYVDDAKRELSEGTMLYLKGSNTHRLHAWEDSSLLVTILLKAKDAGNE